MEDKILNLLKKNKAFSVEEIKNSLNINSVDDLRELMKVLNKLENEYKIFNTKKNKYMLFNNSSYKVGVLSVNKKGFGFVSVEGMDDIYIDYCNMNGAIHGDKVIVDYFAPYDNEGKIVRIVKRNIKNLIGTIKVKKGKYFVNLDDERIKINVVLDKKCFRNLVDGHKVIIRLLKKIDNYNYYGEIGRAHV